MPRPKPISAARWSQIERGVRRRCERNARARGWSRKRTDQCIYGTMRHITQYVQARRRKESALHDQTGAAP